MFALYTGECSLFCVTSSTVENAVVRYRPRSSLIILLETALNPFITCDHWNGHHMVFGSNQYIFFSTAWSLIGPWSTNQGKNDP